MALGPWFLISIKKFANLKKVKYQDLPKDIHPFFEENLQPLDPGL